MDSLIEKLNIFDLFTMLIPGIIISTLLSVSLSWKYYNIWINYGNEKYLIFVVLSYLCGIFLQQFGNIVDEKLLYSIIYGGRPKEIFLLRDKYDKILGSKLLYNEALKTRKYISDKYKIHIDNVESIEQEKQLNSLVFSYVLTIVENNNLSFKTDKMLVISEMSRSLFLGCIFTIVLNIVMVLKYCCYYKFYYIEIIILVILCVSFLYRKIQYEKYRYRIVLRTFLIYTDINRD